MDSDEEQMVLFWEDADEAEQKLREGIGHISLVKKGLPSAIPALSLLREAEAKIKEARELVAPLLPLLPNLDHDLDEAINSIEQSGYSGFSIDMQNWYCVRHSIEVFFDNAFQSVVEYATEKRKSLVTPKGEPVYSWHTSSVNEDTEGIYCSIGNCPARVSQEEEE